jgi:hypothetical protein
MGLRCVWKSSVKSTCGQSLNCGTAVFSQGGVCASGNEGNYVIRCLRAKVLPYRLSRNYLCDARDLRLCYFITFLFQLQINGHSLLDLAEFHSYHWWLL